MMNASPQFVANALRILLGATCCMSVPDIAVRVEPDSYIYALERSDDKSGNIPIGTAINVATTNSYFLFENSH